MFARPAAEMAPMVITTSLLLQQQMVLDKNYTIISS
jgi:hypothetical protein